MTLSWLLEAWVARIWVEE